MAERAAAATSSSLPFLLSGVTRSFATKRSTDRQPAQRRNEQVEAIEALFVGGTATTSGDTLHRSSAAHTGRGGIHGEQEAVGAAGNDRTAFSTLFLFDGDAQTTFETCSTGETDGFGTLTVAQCGDE